jgi:hypothetical protein
MTDNLLMVVDTVAHKAQQWTDLVHVRGGTFNMDKNFFYTIAWKWKPTREAVMCTINDDPDILIALSAGDNQTYLHEIPQKEETMGK